MKWRFKLNGLHLFIILIGSFLLFTSIRPIMEGFSGDTPQAPDILQASAGEQALAAATPPPPSPSQMPSFLQPISEKTPVSELQMPGDQTLVSDDQQTPISSQQAPPPQAQISPTSYSYVGPAGDTVIVDNPRQPMPLPMASQPLGIPKSQIPAGSEDLYILKSQVVPPVCPALPSISSCPKPGPLPACPSCARCPEPSFECKKVPNYRNASQNTYLPRPVLSDFSAFGM
jgi:hypothetical protein